VVPGRGSSVALRPTALRLDPAGELSGTCTAVEPGPDVTRVTVELTDIGELAAVAEGDRPTVGEQVRLRFDPAAAAVLPDPSSPAPSTTEPSGTLDR